MTAESARPRLRFRGNRSNPNFPAVTHMLRCYADHLDAGFAIVDEGPADIHWDVAGDPSGAALALPGRPHARAELACVRTRDHFPAPVTGRLRDRAGCAVLDAAGEFALLRRGETWLCEWDLLSFCADILFRRADLLPERAAAAGEARCRGQFDEAFGLDAEPWVDRWMFRLLGALPHLRPALETLPARARLWLTHDLDNLAKWRVRSVAGQILRTPLQAARGRLPLLARNWGEIAKRILTGRDPYDNLAEVLALEGARKSANFFLATGRDHLFHRYELERPRFARVLRACVDAGADVGLHGQVHFIADGEGMRREKAKLDRLAGFPVRLNRQHYLRWDPARTYPLLEAAGIAVDSTMGYNDAPGFRAGTALPYAWFDCAADKPLRLRVVPLILGEFQFYDPLGFDGDAVRKTIRRYLDVTCRQGGVFTVLFHNNYFHEAEFPGHGAVYRDLIAWADARGLPDFDPSALISKASEAHG